MTSKLNANYINILSNLERAAKDYKDKLSKMRSAKLAVVSNKSKVEEEIQNIRKYVFSDTRH